MVTLPHFPSANFPRKPAIIEVSGSFSVEVTSTSVRFSLRIPTMVIFSDPSGLIATIGSGWLSFRLALDTMVSSIDPSGARRTVIPGAISTLIQPKSSCQRRRSRAQDVRQSWIGQGGPNLSKKTRDPQLHRKKKTRWLQEEHLVGHVTELHQGPCDILMLHLLFLHR